MIVAINWRSFVSHHYLKNQQQTLSAEGYKATVFPYAEQSSGMTSVSI